MTEQELLKKIEESAEEVKVPEALSPEKMKKKLKENKRKRQYWKRMASVAAVTLVCLGGSAAVYRHWEGSNGIENVTQDAAISEGSSGDLETAVEAEYSGAAGSNEKVSEIVIGPKQDAGDLYVIASDYREVYDLLSAYDSQNRYDGMDAEDAAREEGAVEIAPENAATTVVLEDKLADKAESAGAGGAFVEKESYSGTNLQMAGVDESDIIKTDGAYIYTVTDSRVIITDVQQEKMKQCGQIEISMNSASDYVLEMYVDGDILNVIVQKESADLEKSAVGEETDYKDAENSGMLPVEDVYYFNSNVETEIQSYDITDRANPVLKGSVAQDGYYKTSRKIGDIIYLFTEKTLNRPKLAKDAAIAEEGIGDWIPLVDEKAVAADCIYIPESGNNGLIISSVNVKKPEDVVDNTLILNHYVDIYVSSSAFYLYGLDYSASGETTQIAKFTLEKGAINAVGAASAKGCVRDTFAINEYKGKLRLLTTNWMDGESENGLYLFDEKLNLTGKLEGLAEGEEIYAARYFGNTAYFVTYRNTDPLFAVDLTDETQPKILSELKITGFSEYLHFWGKDKLLGIGYETDPDSGERKGIKLTMFDISNPAELKTAGTCVIEDIDASPALYNYKCVLADEKENLIGFAAQSYGRINDKNSYLLFTWEDGNFKNLMTEQLREDVFAEEYRGIYIGDRFYLAEKERIASYDRKDGYRLLEKLELK